MDGSLLDAKIKCLLPCMHQKMTERICRYLGMYVRATLLKLAEGKWPIKKKDHHPFFISPAATEKRGWHVPPQQPSLDHLHQPLSASTRAHAPQAISNPLTATRAQLQKPNPPPILLFRHQLPSHNSILSPSSNLTNARVLTEPINHITFFPPTLSNLSKWLPRLLTRSPPPPRLLLLPPRLLRRRMPARRLLLLVTRRSAPRLARRLTLLTSTRVSFNPISIACRNRTRQANLQS
jgi:hypothetical protein